MATKKATKAKKGKTTKAKKSKGGARNIVANQVKTAKEEARKNNKAVKDGLDGAVVPEEEAVENGLDYSDEDTGEDIDDTDYNDEYNDEFFGDN
jgi:hypothetical protein